MKEFKKNGLPTPETRSFIGSKLKQGVPFEAARAAE
jgi:hypothetical protein